MAKDFKPATPKKKNKASNKAAPGWLWLTAGLGIGLFVAFLVYLQGRPEPLRAVAKAPAAESSAAGRQAKVPAEAAEKRRFEFYTLLPEMEVVVPQAESGRDGAPKSAPKTTETGTYELQAGSFKRHADADSRKAALALLGVESDIQRVTLTNNETWHRVRIGPYSNLKELNEVRARLQENDIETLLVKIRGKS